MAETIVPQDHQIGGTGSVDSPLNAYDQNPVSVAKLVANAVFTYSELTLYDFTADADPANRTLVTVRVRISQQAWSNPNDRGYILFKPHGAAAWVELAVYDFQAAPTKATWVEFDVTALVGSLPASGFLVAGQFVKGTTFKPPEPNDPPA